MKKVFLLSLLFSVHTIAAKISPAFVSALEFGGDQLVNVTYTDGSKSDIEAGRGVIIAGGVDVSYPQENNIEHIAQFTLGIKWTSTKQANNGDINWKRFPLEALYFYKDNDKNFKVGGGLSYHFNNTLRGTKDLAGLNISVDNALGYTLEADYLLGEEKKMLVGVRTTLINYTASGAKESASGNSFGVNFNYYWY